jgi:hypothetical protein
VLHGYKRGASREEVAQQPVQIVGVPLLSGSFGDQDPAHG